MSRKGTPRGTETEKKRWRETRTLSVPPPHYLHISHRVVQDRTGKQRLVGSTLKGRIVTQTMLKESIWEAKQRRKKALKEEKAALQK